MDGRAPGYWLSPDHFQTVKRMLVPDWAQKMLCIIVPNRRTVSPEFFSWVRTRRLLSRHSCPVRSPSFPNQKRRNYRWVEKRFGCYQQEQFNLHWENSVSDGSQCIVNNRNFKMKRRRESKKAIAWQGKTTTLLVHHAFLYISLPSLHDYHVKMPNFTFCEGRKQAMTKFILFMNLDMVDRNSAPEEFACIWQSERVGIITIKTEKIRIHFSCDVFVAVSCRDILNSLIRVNTFCKLKLVFLEKRL